MGMDRKTVLAGDIGGTKTLLMIAEVAPGRIEVKREQRYVSRDFGDFLDIVRDFLQQTGPLQPDGACFGVAGPVTEGRAQITNLPWTIEAAALACELGIPPRVRLINDFQAVAYGIEALEQGDLATLLAGRPHPHGVRAVIGAGTGLGEGYMVWQGDHYEALGSEGSHADFAPADETQMELLRFLRRRYGHVSYERVVSGPGLVNIYEFLRERGGVESARLRQAMEQGDAAAAISEFALARQDELASAALEMFVAVYGAEAGNLALKVLASGGVYVAGGIAPKILRKLQEGAFIRAFLDKGRFSALLAQIPVYVVRNPKVGLMGAALAAARL